MTRDPFANPARDEAPPEALRHLVSAPRFALLRWAIESLERAGIGVALGGSGLLAALGLTDRVRDWDLTTDAPAEAVTAALAGETSALPGALPGTLSGHDALHADHKLAFADGALEIILGFAFFTPAGVVRIPTRVHERKDGLPLASPEGWAVAYHLLGRAEKSRLLFQYLASRGAKPGVLAELLAQPLPPGMAARLAALPTSSVT
jgi:hypothetical protein